MLELGVVIFMQLVVMLICMLLSKDIKAEIKYNLMKIRAGYREITRNEAIGLLVESCVLDLFVIMFLLLVCANSYKMITYIY